MGAHADRVEPRHPAARLALAVAVALALAACSTTGAGKGGVTTTLATTSSTTSSSTTTSSTTSTTTTLPVPVDGGGSSIVRVRVAALAPGATIAAAVSPASPAWLKMVPIAFRSLGSGPDLLLIAGQDGSLSWWDSALLTDLSRHYRVTVFDLPGVGYSGAATASFSLGWLADMTAGFALAAGLSHPVVLGWGLGGEIALSLAERHPGLASSLVLVDTSAGGAAAPQPSRSVARLLALPGATPVALARLLFREPAPGWSSRGLWVNSLLATPDWLTAGAITAEARLQAAFWRASPLTPELSRVTIPVLVVSGSDDLVFPPGNAPLLEGELRHARLVTLASSGYGAILQDEPAFVAAVERFTG